MSDCALPPRLLSVDEARARLLRAVVPLADIEEVALALGLGRVLASDVVARVDVPPANNSAMDGFALRYADLLAAAGHALPVAQRIPAGHIAPPLAVGTAARIFTGAEIPPGADVVVMQEDCEYDAQQLVLKPAAVAQVQVGDNIRPRGQDMAAGAVVVARGERLGAAQLGVVAAAGHGTVTVVRRVRVAIFSTGDELLEPGVAPAPGCIYNSNRYALLGYLTQLGCEVVDLGVVPDRREATEHALREAAGRADLVITTGGASVGEEDHLRAALSAVGKVDLWKIAIKPGKPLLFGQVRSGRGTVPVLGLPGNPVAVAVTFMVFAVPFLRALQGAITREIPPLRLPAAFRVQRAGSRTEYLRVRLEPSSIGVRLARFLNQSSGVLTSMAWADGLAVVPAGVTVEENDRLVYLPFSALLA